jgi:hypothetical protein
MHIQRPRWRPARPRKSTLLIYIIYKTNSALVHRANTGRIHYAEVLSLRLPIFRTRAVTTHLLTLLFLRVLKPPLDGWPHGLVGCLLPFDLPRPPPCGWSSDVMLVAE